MVSEYPTYRAITEVEGFSIENRLMKRPKLNKNAYFFVKISNNKEIN